MVTLVFPYIRRLRPFFLFKILHFNIFRVFRKMNKFWGMNILWIFLGASQNWTIFRGHFRVFSLCQRTEWWIFFGVAEI